MITLVMYDILDSRSVGTQIYKIKLNYRKDASKFLIIKTVPGNLAGSAFSDWFGVLGAGSVRVHHYSSLVRVGIHAGTFPGSGFLP